MPCNNRNKQRRSLRDNRHLMLFHLILLCGWHPICCHGLSTAPESDTRRLLQTPDGYTIDEAIQPAEQDLRLEDFFWTGSGDGPPHYVRKPNVASESDGATGRDTILKTATVVATVYIDQAQDTEPIRCIYDCEDEENGDISSDYFPTDRRYWLLTILGGHYRTHDFAVIQQKLASLYRIAFSRQQLWHLGVDQQTVYNQSNPSSDPPSVAPPIAPTASNQILPTKYSEYNNLAQMSEHRSTNESSVGRRGADLAEHLLTKRSVETTITSTPTWLLNESGTNGGHADAGTVPRGHSMPLRGAAQAGTKISVLVHNITLLCDDEFATRRMDGPGGVQRPSKTNAPTENQTEIIYSVFVDGKPVLAATAADDMKLVTEDEVARVMDKIVYTKAEPYVKEAQATALVPSDDNDDSPGNQHANIFATILERPVWIAVGSVLIVMVIVLFIGLMLMTRSKRLRSAELKRLTVHRALIEESANQAQAATGSSHVAKPDAADGGNDNLAFINDGSRRHRSKGQSKSGKSGQPVIHFPQPPAGSPTSSSTSDSSIYYPKRRSRLDIQHILDEKAVNLFHHHKKDAKHASDQEDALYATIDKTKERKLKQKRKYTTNRVGSVEDDADSAQGSNSSDNFETISRRTHYYDPVEAINPNAAPGNYHSNKLLSSQYFTERSREEDGLAASPTEAYNREVIRSLYRENQSPGSGSIGSFLSMASVRSFPKCTMPEPLNRVLEPLSVMHLDQSDGGLDSSRHSKPRVSNKTPTRKGELDHSKRGGDAPLVRSQSDGADPGVIGPVVWEIHKKQLEQSGGILSPIRDPVKTRNRFEGLLEGAIDMYSGDISNEVIDEINSTTDHVTQVRRRDTRLKTALPVRKPSILSRSNTEHAGRPVTAGHTNHTHEQPPSPYRRAWGSGAPSPLVRPLSAGPFHRPEPPQVDVTRVLAPQNHSTILSTAPLIEAIQNELKKFDKPNRGHQ